jgi:hypothetical protein
MRFPVLALATLLAGCTAAPTSLAPVGMMPVTAEQVRSWVGSTLPGAPTSIQYGAVFTDQHSATSKGRGTISILPGDSLRFDFTGPLGMGRSAAAVVGDSALWAEPKEDVEKLVPSYPLLWAMVGVARPPSPGDGLKGLQRGEVTAWQYVGRGDTVTYVRSIRELRAEVRREGRVFGVVITTFGVDGVLSKSRLEVTSPQARLDITFRKVLSVKGFDKGIWDAPGQQ